MDEVTVMKLAKDAVLLVLLVSAPSLILGLLVGLAVSVFQAVTSIQEMTLAMIPKILAVFLSLVLCGPWIIRLLTTFTYQLLINIPHYVR